VRYTHAMVGAQSAQQTKFVDSEIKWFGRRIPEVRIGQRPLILTIAGFLLLVLPVLPGNASRSLPRMQEAPAKTQRAKTTTPDPTAGIEVTALALPPSKFCALGPRAYVVYVPMDITVVNGRRTPIILTRYARVQRVLLGKNNDDVLAHKYELVTPMRSLRSPGNDVVFGSQPSDDSFTVLKHNQSFDFTTVEGIPVRNDPADNIPGTVSPGDLALSVELQTWPFAREASSLREQWSRIGDLITAPVTGYPTIIKLPANPTTENCGMKEP
jgi:hypothetical protein